MPDSETPKKKSLKVIRGSAEYANCGACPFSKNGRADRPVVFESPEDPDWILIGEGPGCFPAGTQIVTPNGNIALENIKSGDVVSSGVGKPTKVVKTFQRDHTEGLITITVLGGRAVTMTSQHPVFVYPLKAPTSGHGRRQLGEGFWIDAKNVTRDHAVFFPFTLLPTNIDSIDQSEHPVAGNAKHKIPRTIPLTTNVAFLLGMYIGDGSSASGSIRIDLSVGYKERHVETIKRVFREEFCVEPTEKREGKNISIVASSSSLSRWFLDSFGTHCWNKRVPDFIMHASDEVKSAFLFGWYETDGKHLRNLNKPRGITTTSHQAALDAHTLFLSIRTFPVFRKEHPSKKSKGKLPWYVIGVNNSDIKTLKWDIEIHDKKPRQIQTRLEHGFAAPVRSVTFEEWAGKVYNIETESHDYLAPFRVHNSNESYQGKPFVGPSGEVVNKFLSWIGRPREEVMIQNATLCLPTRGSNDHDKLEAARCCKPRLLMELKRFPGKPILLLGGVASKAVIPEEIMNAIDPPEGATSYKKKQKDKQQAALDEARKKERKLAILRLRLYKQLVKDHALFNKKKPSKKYIETLAEDTLRLMEESASLAAKKKLEELEKEAKIARIEKRKKKGVSISDIMSTHFFIDIGDGTGKRSVVPTIHPAAILRGGRSVGGAHTPDLMFWNLVSDAGKVDAIAKGKDIILTFEGSVEYEDADKANRLVKQVFNEAIKSGEIAIDLETYVEDPDRHHALQMYVAKIRAIGLSTKEWGCSVIWDLLNESSKILIRILLISLTIKKIFHNGLYDRTVLRAYGYPIQGPWDDTMLLHHTTFPGASHKLQSVTAQFKAVDPWKSEFRNQEETPERLVAYCFKDTQSTAIIEAPLAVWCKRTGVEKAYALDKAMAQIASSMHLDGVPMSREVNQQLFNQFSGVIMKAREIVETLADDVSTRKSIWNYLAFEQAKKKRKIDPDSHNERQKIRLAEIEKAFVKGKWKWKMSAPQHVGALLRALGVELLAITKGGATKVDKETLEGLIEIPIVQSVINFRENDKRRSTFIWPIFDRILASGATTYGFADKNDRVHPIWSIHKITGRWASSEPVCSNYPKARFKVHPDGRKEILIPDLRAQVVAPEGRIFVGFDFCLDSETLIDTPKGYKEIRNLHPGDIVYSFNVETNRQDISKVISVTHTGWRETLSVVLDNGEEVRCTPDHRWLTEENREIEAKDLIKGCKLLSFGKQRHVKTVINDRKIVSTYDISVERDHNFALKAGVFVHNCQLEARIISLLSGDEWLCNVFASGKDIHREAAKLIWGETRFNSLPAEEQKKLRDLAKPFEYGAFYGADPETLYKALLRQNVVLQRSDVYLAHSTLMKGMPGVTRYQSNLLIEAAKPPFELRTFLTSRRRCFPLGEVERNEAYNWPVQAAGADIMNTGMERIMHRLLKYKQAFPILQIHDAAVFECAEDDAENLQQDVIECFTQEYCIPGTQIAVPFPVDCKISKSWAGL